MAYYFISIVKQYYRFLQQVYFIRIIEILSTKPDLAFQIFFKIFINLVGLNRLVFILLIFDTYLKMTELDAIFLLFIY